MTQPATTVRGWTDSRVRRAVMFAVLLGAAAVLALWAMTQPWVAISIGNAAPTCSRTAGTSSTSVLTGDGTTTTMNVSGCISGLKSVHQDKFVQDLGVDPATVLESGNATIGVPQATSKVGIPAATFWLLAAALAAAVGCLLRNTAIIAVAAFPLRWSYTAFAEHRRALVWGLDPAPYSEMRGIALHSYAFAAVALLALAGAVFVFKVNAEMRKIAFEQFQRGERERPAGLTTIAIIGNAILRLQTDKFGALADKAVTDAKDDEHTGAARRVPAGARS